MTTKEYPPHREAMLPWLEGGGKIIQYWKESNKGYPVSYYVVAFVKETSEDRFAGVVIYCFRVFGGIVIEGEEFVAQVSADQVASIFPDNTHAAFSLQHNPNWKPVEGYE